MTIKESDLKKLNELIADLEKYRKTIISIDYIHNKEDFFDIMKELRKYLASLRDESLYDMFFHSKYYKVYKDFFTDTNMYYLRTVESVQSLSIITKWSHNFNSFTNLMDRDIIIQSFESKRNEMKYLDFNKAKTLIMVWSWPMPETLLYIYENTNIDNIIWIDINHEAVFLSWEMLNWLNVDKITLHRWDWVKYDYSDADIIYMPLYTYPKDKILERIVETWKPWVQILLSNPKWFWNLLFKWLWTITPRLKINIREDTSNPYNSQEVLKLEKYDF